LLCYTAENFFHQRGTETGTPYHYPHPFQSTGEVLKYVTGTSRNFTKISKLGGLFPVIPVHGKYFFEISNIVLECWLIVGIIRDVYTYKTLKAIHDFLQTQPQ
jgi:hypothetical protein